MINTNVKKQYPVIRMPNGHPVSSTMYNRGDLHGVIYNNDVEFDDVLLSNITATSTVFANLNVSTNISSNTSSLSFSLANVTVSKLINSTVTTTSNITADVNLAYNLSLSLLATGTTTADLTVGGAFDADAAAFFARVTAAGGTLTTTEQNAVNTLVVQMKADGTWTKMKAIYPMVGASAAACRQNLRSASFTGTFSSGWTFANTGATPNGTSAFMNTGLNPVAQGLNTANSHLSYYCQTTSTTSDPAEIANYTSNFEGFVLQSAGESNSIRFFYSYNLRATFGTLIRPLGLISGSSTNGNTRRDIYRNGVSIGFYSGTDSASLGNYNLYLGAANINNTSVASYSNSRCAFASIGQGLSSIDMSNLYTAVQAFQTSLNRQV